MWRRARQTCLLSLALVALGLASPVLAHDRDEVSRAGVCTKSSSARLDLREEEHRDGKDEEGKDGNYSGSISVTFRVQSHRSGVIWSVILLHERRIVFRGSLRTLRPRGHARPAPFAERLLRL
jgi:hypothetical protein